MPRILHLVPRLFGERGVTGGAERYALELARHMADREDTTLVSFADRDTEETSGNLKIRLIGRPWEIRGQINNPFSLKLLPHLAKADVIHCHQYHVFASSFAALFSRLSGKRVFVSDLGGGGWDISSYVSTDRLYHGHLHISEYSRRLAGHEGRQYAHVILGGVDTDKFSPGASPPSRTILYVGRLLPHKGINYLIEMLPPGLSLRVVGRPYHDRYFSELKRLAENKPVVFETGSDDDALVNAYRGALCIVLPSVYRDLYGNESRVPELLGQTLLEGMACGIPAICTDVASMPEVVADNITGFIVPPNDPSALAEKFTWLRDHPGEVSAMGKAARQRILEKFTWKQVVDRCLHIYGLAS